MRIARPRTQMHFHLYATIAWSVVLLAAITGLVLLGVHHQTFLIALLGVAFVSLCSIYANMVGHWSSYQATKAEVDTPTREDLLRVEGKVDKLAAGLAEHYPWGHEQHASRHGEA